MRQIDKVAFSLLQKGLIHLVGADGLKILWRDCCHGSTGCLMVTDEIPAMVPIMLTIPAAHRRTLRIMAAEQGTTMTALVRVAIARAVSELEAEPAPVPADARAAQTPASEPPTAYVAPPAMADADLPVDDADALLRPTAEPEDRESFTVDDVLRDAGVLE
jgi:hypothetical protein